MNMRLSFFAIATLLGGHLSLNAQQAVSELWTDFGSDNFWYSETASDTMDNDAMVLAFKTGETIYSTGVDDDLVTDSLGGDGFTPLSFEAIPIPSIETTTGNYFKGAAWDGDLDNATDAEGIDADSLATYLTDGSQGLNITTGINNLSEMVISYVPESAPDLDKLDDGIPDLLLSQIAGIGGENEKVFLTDSEGIILGDTLVLSFSDRITIWYADAWKISNGKNKTTKESRVIYLTSIELIDFNLSSEDLPEIAFINVKTSGKGDPGFFAYNSDSFGTNTGPGTVVMCYLEVNKCYFTIDGEALGLELDREDVENKAYMRWLFDSLDTTVVGDKTFYVPNFDEE